VDRKPFQITLLDWTIGLAIAVGFLAVNAYLFGP
jgi:hypothetical protein